ncbi:hypothetical protein Tco_0097926 [Tanacetum coccineum]
MSTYNIHQQSLVDASSETRPLMLERGNYIPWASRFKRYLNRKRENRKWLNKVINEGPYKFKEFTPSKTKPPRMQTEEDLTGDDLKYYEAEIEAMNLILISILNDIYNSVDACTTTQAMWQRYVTQVRLAKKLTKDSYDDLFDYLSQYEKLVNASRAKKLEKSHDPIALVAHMGFLFQNFITLLCHTSFFSSITQCFSNPTNDRLRTSSNTKNQAIVQADRVNIQSRNSGNDDINTRRSFVLEEVIEVSKDEAGLTLTDEQNDFLFADATLMGEIKKLNENICLMARTQPTNIDSDAGPSYDSAFLIEVQTPSTSYVNPLFAKDNQEQKYPKQPKIINNTIGDDQIDIIFDEPNVDVNSGSVEHDNNVQASYALEQLALNAYKEAEKQQINADKEKTTK